MTERTSKFLPWEPMRPKIDTPWKPVTINYINACVLALATCPGPNRLTVRQLKAVPAHILAKIFNLFLLCGKLSERLLKARTTLIPKKDGVTRPENYRPITVRSVLTRPFHKILARRLTSMVPLDSEQKAFLPKYRGAENIFCLNLILRYRQNFKLLYLASTDIAKTND